MSTDAPFTESPFDDNEPRMIGRRVIHDRTFHRLARDMLDARFRCGLSQGVVAARMHTSQSALSRLLAAAGPRPTLTTLEKFAVAVGCRLEIRFVSLIDEWLDEMTRQAARAR